MIKYPLYVTLDTKRTVEQAKKDMGIISYKLGDKWYWQLNGSDVGERI